MVPISMASMKKSLYDMSNVKIFAMQDGRRFTSDYTD